MIIDVSDSSNPQLLGSYDTPGFANDVFVSGSTAYMAIGSGGFLILNVSDPLHRHLLQNITLPGPVTA